MEQGRISQNEFLNQVNHLVEGIENSFRANSTNIIEEDIDVIEANLLLPVDDAMVDDSMQGMFRCNDKNILYKLHETVTVADIQDAE